MKLTLIINSQEGPIATIEGWDGPIPRPGEYIFHPPLGNRVISRDVGVMSVKSVTYGILARPKVRTGQFAARDEPYVEVYV